MCLIGVFLFALLADLFADEQLNKIFALIGPPQDCDIEELRRLRTAPATLGESFIRIFSHPNLGLIRPSSLQKLSLECSGRLSPELLKICEKCLLTLLLNLSISCRRCCDSVQDHASACSMRATTSFTRTPRHRHRWRQQRHKFLVSTRSRYSCVC